MCKVHPEQNRNVNVACAINLLSCVLPGPSLSKSLVKVCVISLLAIRVGRARKQPPLLETETNVAMAVESGDHAT